jgi:peptidoglycan/LPS O-acetylase OafA/YrhL
LAVVLLHIHIRMAIAGFSFQSQFPPWLFHLLFRNGNNGVSVFFAISGFLITSVTLRRFGSLGGINAGAFYRMRFARIAPLLLLVLLILSLLHLLQAPGFHIPPSKATLPRALFAALTFHLNWLEAVRGYLPPNWDVLWSLSVEEAFYFFFPFACLLMRTRLGKPLFFALLLALIVAGPFARTIWNSTDIAREKTYWGGMDCIAMGCLAALVVHRLRDGGKSQRAQQNRWWFTPLQVLGSLLLFFIALWPHSAVTRFIGRSGLDSTLLGLGACLVAIPAALNTVEGRRWTEPVRWLGRNSYEVYMTHEFIVVWAVAAYVKWQAGPRGAWILAMTAVASVLGAVVAKYYSEPLNKHMRGKKLFTGTAVGEEELQRAT